MFFDSKRDVEHGDWVVRQKERCISNNVSHVEDSNEEAWVDNLAAEKDACSRLVALPIQLFSSKTDGLEEGEIREGVNQTLNEDGGDIQLGLGPNQVVEENEDFGPQFNEVSRNIAVGFGPNGKEVCDDSFVRSVVHSQIGLSELGPIISEGLCEPKSGPFKTAPEPNNLFIFSSFFESGPNALSLRSGRELGIVPNLGRKKKKSWEDILGYSTFDGKSQKVGRRRKKTKQVIFRSAIAAASLSLSSDGIRNRNRLLLNEAQAIWSMGRIVGGEAVGPEEEIISKLAKMEGNTEEIKGLGRERVHS